MKKLALASDPLSGYAHAQYALTCVIAGKTAEGVEVSRGAVQLDSESFVANWVLQVALLSSGQLEAASWRENLHWLYPAGALGPWP